MAHSLVPKFGDWDGENVPYTVYFENARRERMAGGFIMNPNDPQQNPDAFNTSSMEKRSHQRRRRGSQASFAPDSDGHRSISDYSSSSQKGVRSADDKRSMAGGGSVGARFSTSPIHTRQSGSHSSIDYTNHRETSIPKFGAWDETDPESGEGFTVIFNKIKEEKQIASAQYPTVSPQPANYPKIQNQHGGSSSRLSKYCCFLFSCQSK